MAEIFKYIVLLDERIVEARMEGHADAVIEDFREVAARLLSARGAWRITEVTGRISDEEILDSKMQWTLKAELKNRRENS